MIPCILAEQNLPVQTSGAYTLISLEITTPPEVTHYFAGDKFDSYGMKVNGNYGVDGVVLKTVDVTSSVTFSPLEDIPDGCTGIEVSMRASDGKLITTTQPIVTHTIPVSMEPLSGELDGPFYFGDKYPEDIQVSVTYSDGSKKNKTATMVYQFGAIVTPETFAYIEAEDEEEYEEIPLPLPTGKTTFDKIGPYELSYTYTEAINCDDEEAHSRKPDSSGGDFGLIQAGLPMPAVLIKVTVNVQPKPINQPTWKFNLTYTGNQVDVGSADYWGNWIDGAWTASGMNGLQAGTYTAVFTLTENYQWSNMTSEPYSVQWAIDKAVITIVPSQSGSLTYSGSTQSPAWSNYSSTQLSISGDTSGTNAGNYTVRFTPTSNYRWSDNAEYEEVQWSIGKASRTITFTPSSLTLTDTAPVTVQMSSPGGGDWAESDWSSSSYFFTYSIDKTTGVITITGDGSGSGAQVFQAMRKEDQNYKKCYGTLHIVYDYSFHWGDETVVGDAKWWSDLKTWITSESTAAERKECVGKTKQMTLTTVVLGTTTHSIRCIGADEDGDKTLTFQTANCLANTTTWSTTDYSTSNTTAARWIDSNCQAKAECLNYYKALPGYSGGTVPYIKTVKKGTCDSTNDSRNGTPTYRDETVFLPSELEMGLNSYSPLSKANSTNSKAENTQGLEPKGYSYYTSSNSRIKNLGDTGSAQWYWERSRYYSSSSYNPTRVCRVYSSGIATGDDYWFSGGLAPAFVVG